MIGFHAEVLALLSNKPRPRSQLLACFPKTTHPDAVHKALYELLRAGVVTSTAQGLILTPAPKEDAPLCIGTNKEAGSRGGKTTQHVTRERLKRVKRYNAVGDRYCPCCEAYLPIRSFKLDLSAKDGFYVRCKPCDNGVRREKRANRADAA